MDLKTSLIYIILLFFPCILESYGKLNRKKVDWTNAPPNFRTIALMFYWIVY